MVGSALYRNLQKDKSRMSKFELITKDRSELNLLNQKDVNDFFENKKLDQVYLAAAKVGGIFANYNYPAEFIYENLLIELNIINAAFKSGVKKLLFLGSSCVYPKYASQPISENQLLSGLLEKTNEPYALAKIAGIKLCESYNRQYGKRYGIDYRCVMPSNLYGVGDNYHSLNSHVIPGLIKKFHLAKINEYKTVKVWGSGKARREFLYVNDLAKACTFIMNLNKRTYKSNTMPTQSHINIGSGEEISIRQLALLIQKEVGFKGKIIFEINKPDGTPRKLIDSAKINKLGWTPSVKLKQGLRYTYNDFKKKYLKKIG